ncbi:MAG: serine hydrolase [Ignavibacteriae bacterium]|nr:MAG: serine hydrolase [Ignavibacteriota bacterium]
MKKIFLILILLSLATIIAVCNNSYQDKPAQTTGDKFANIDSVIVHAIKDSAFPGAVVLVSKDGEVIYEKGFGHFTYDESSSEVKINTIYDIASLTKVIATTTAAMSCLDRNLFQLNEPVYNHIPEFSENGKEAITIENLLLHNSGLPAWKKFYNKNLDADSIIKNIYSIKPEYPAGTKTVYSDLGIIVLGKLIETVTHKKLDQYCNDEIFIPLKMNNTCFNPPDSVKYKIPPTEIDKHWRKKLVQGEVHDETSSLLGGVAGHAGLFSTAEDLSKLIQMLLDEGIFSGKQFIKPETVKLFTKRHSPKSTRALGWDTKSTTRSSAGNKFSKTSFGHTGFTGTSIWIDPERKLFVVFLTNRVYPSRENKKIINVRPKLHNAVISATD